MDNTASIKKASAAETGDVVDMEGARKKSATRVPDVHKGATEDKVIPVPAPADPELFEDEPRQG